MLEIVFGIFVLCLSAVGLIEIFKIISLSLLNRREFNEGFVTILPIYGHKEEIEMILRNEISSVKWLGEAKNRQIVCLDLGMDAETQRICEIFSEEYDFIEIYSMEEFNMVMKQSSVQIG